MKEIKQNVIDRIEALQGQLWGISQSLYQNPEIAFKEHKSSALLADILEEAGFEVERGVGGLETAFKGARSGKTNKPTIAFLAEYDALPKIGHGCGHNLIAAAAIGAGLGLTEVIGSLSGQVLVIGTPAEEGGGGKRILIDAGVFKGVDAAMMFHPSSKTMVLRGSLASMRLELEFFGKPAHAAASPQEGINALDAIILTFNNINALRQHLDAKDRIHGIITHGGDAANVVPEYTRAEFSVRGKTSSRREQVLEKVLACAEGAAKATGCKLKYEISEGYAEIVPNQVIGELFTNNIERFGRVVEAPRPDEPMGSTDMGNVSRLVPAIHPYLAVVPKEIPGHSEEFREGCMTDDGIKAVLDAAKAMAMTAVDIMDNPSLLQQARAELDEYLSAEGETQ